MSDVLEPRARRAASIPWVDDLPEDWEVLPFAAVCRENRRSNAGLRETNLLSLSFGRVVRRDISSNDGLLPESFETYQVVEPNDVVFRLTDLQNDKRSLRTALVRERGILTSAYLTVRLTNAHSRFFAYLMRDVDNRKVLYSMGGGLRQSMKFDDIKRLPIQMPPLAGL
jgi:type I restriction enzyme S subunit